MVRINLALMEAENARRAAERARPALHPLAEYYGEWERARAKVEPEDEGSFSISMTGDEG